MISLKNSYHPLEAAILWSNLQEHREEILSSAPSYPINASQFFPQWPLLFIYAERIFDAINFQELPATYLGCPFVPDSGIDITFASIRLSDLRIWILRYHPNEAPSFLFGQQNNHSHCITIGSYLTVTAELKAANLEIRNLRAQLSSAYINTKTQPKEHYDSSAKTTDQSTTPLSSAILYTIIGALLEVTIGKSRAGRDQSIYKNQTALVETIVTRFNNVPGISKRTLDRKFAEARRRFTQAQ